MPRAPLPPILKTRSSRRATQRATPALLALLPLFVLGCIPKPTPSFESSAPNARLSAIVMAADQADPASLAALVGQLESDDPAARLLAAAALRKRTGETFGYNAGDPEWRREPAVQRWRDHLASLATQPDVPDTLDAPDANGGRDD